jgi:hypothetical protein
VGRSNRHHVVVDADDAQANADVILLEAQYDVAAIRWYAASITEKGGKRRLPT